MAERLAAGAVGMVLRSGIPVSTQEVSSSIARRNSLNLGQLYDYQRATDESCFFVALYAMSMALYPGKQLPDAAAFLADIRPRYGGEAGVLEADRLLVRNDRLTQALQIYNEWGMRVRQIERNSKARDLLSASLYPYESEGLVRDSGSYAPLCIDNRRPPFAVWMHEGVTNQAHFVTVDGSREAYEMINDYQQNRKYFVKMIIDVERQDKGWEGEQPGAAGA